MTGTLHEDLSTFMIMPRSILLRIRNISDKRCRENRSTHFMFKNFFFEIPAICDIMWKNMVQPETPQMTMYYGAEKIHMHSI